jgi:hypothetical protein
MEQKYAIKFRSLAAVVICNKWCLHCYDPELKSLNCRWKHPVEVHSFQKDGKAVHLISFDVIYIVNQEVKK